MEKLMKSMVVANQGLTSIKDYKERCETITCKQNLYSTGSKLEFLEIP